jgi:type IV secretion system protein VirD4
LKTRTEKVAGFSQERKTGVKGIKKRLWPQKSIVGEDLPTSPTTGKVFAPRLKVTAGLAIPIYLLLQLGIGFLAAFVSKAAQAAAAAQKDNHLEDLLKNGSKIAGAAFKTAFNPVNTAIYWHLLALFFALILAWRFSQYFNYKTRQAAYGQLGDSRLLTIKEIQERYKEIAESKVPFDGYGGMAVSHYKQKFYLNDETVNTMVVGTSRSGKGQAVVIETIDNLSRARKRSSMVVNDPKGELFTASYETLQKRGYDVYALNLDDPDQSMSYNPLTLITRAWQRGDREGATQMINSLDHVLYNGQDAGENRWVYEGAQSAVNGMIMSLLDYNIERNQPQKTTLYNIADMLNELGQLNYMADSGDTVNALDRFFQSLPPDSLAKKQYGSTSFSGEKAKGSILSTVNQGLQMFTLTKNAKMTSKNSLELKSLGFPKSLTMRLPAALFNERLVLEFYRNNQLIKTSLAKVGASGFTEHNFEGQLRTNDILKIKLKTKPEQAARYRLVFHDFRDDQGEVVKKKEAGHEQENEVDKHVTCEEISNTLGIENLEMYYSDKPIALFLLIPDADTSNHGLASIFIRQLYTELVKQCAYIASHKCPRRIHFVLDEFGNMTKIPDMAQILTVTNGRNMLWDLVVQSYQQLYSLYGEADGNTIKENCQVQNYVFSTNDDTIEEISKKVGNYTNIAESTNKTEVNTNENVQQNAEADRVLPYERVSSLLEGETIVLDPLHRRDNKGRKVRPYPIFNTKETAMPYAYEYLKDDFDPDRDINDIEIKSDHAALNLQRNAIDYRDFIVDEEGRNAYDERLAKGQASAVQQALRDAPKDPVQKYLEGLGLSESMAQTIMNAFDTNQAEYTKLISKTFSENAEDWSKVNLEVQRLRKEEVQS